MAPRVVGYGSHPSQHVELTVPVHEAPAPVAVLVHGGFWKQAHGAEHARPLVPSLLARGWATLVIEYRRVGDGGGFPATLDDVAAAVDTLDTLADAAGHDIRLDLDHVVAIGHSAGGQLAAWSAARGALPDRALGSAPRVQVTAVVAQAGVLDLRRAAHDRLGGGAVERFLGGSPGAVPDRYAVADPSLLLPLGVPVLCVHGAADDVVPLSQSTDFAQRARRAGDVVDLTVVDGDHFAVIDPQGVAWATTLDWLDTYRGAPA